MNVEKLNNLIRALKLEIVNILLYSDLTNDKEAQRVLLTIDNTFQQIGQQVDDVLPPAVLEAYTEGMDEAERVMYEYNLTDGQIRFQFDADSPDDKQISVIRGILQTQLHYDAVAEITENLMMDLKAAIRTAQHNTNLSITNALTEVRQDLQSGMIRGSNRKKIQSRIANSFEKNGFTSFLTVDGRELPLDFYSQVVTRTNLKFANIKGSENRYREHEVKYFTVSGNTPTCGQCAQYRGFTFSMNREDTLFPYLDPNTFPVHPNCQCMIRPYMVQFRDAEELKKDQDKAALFEPGKDHREPWERELYEKRQRINRQNNYEKKRYFQIKSIMGDDAPKTLGAFKRMKRANTENYMNLITEYQWTMKDLKSRGILK